jgi:hypothetical protein
MLAEARGRIDARNRLELIDSLVSLAWVEKKLADPQAGCAHVRRAATLARDVDFSMYGNKPSLATDLAGALAACGG